jgi:hypothetical protein
MRYPYSGQYAAPVTLRSLRGRLKECQSCVSSLGRHIKFCRFSFLEARMRIVVAVVSVLLLADAGTVLAAQTDGSSAAVVKAVAQPKPKPVWPPLGIPWQVGVFY